MPDFRIIGQAPVQGPDIGASYDRGLGNANPSTLGNLYEGVKDGLDFGTKLSARIEQTDALAKETERLNDPERLAREKLREELANKALEQGIIKSQIDNTLDLLYGPDKAKYSNDKLRAEALKTQEEFDLSRAYGREDREIEQDLKRSQASENNARAEYLRNGGAGGSSGDPAKRRLAQVQELRRLEKMKADLQQDSSGRTDPFSGEVVAPKVSAEDQQTIAAIDDSIEILKTDIASAEQAPQARYERNSAGLQRQTENTVLSDKANRTGVISESFQKAQNYIDNANSSYTTPTEAVTGWAGEIASINEQIRNAPSPQQKQDAQLQLAEQLKAIGPDLIEQTSASKKGKDKQNFDQTIEAARALSGNTELLSQPQKRAQAIGLPPKYVEAPVKAQQDLNALITLGGEYVDDDDFKKALQTDPIVVGMQAALEEVRQENPKGLLTVKPVIRPYDKQTDGMDVADQQQSTMVVKFLKPNGQYAGVQAPAPAQDDTRGQAVLSMVQEFAKTQAPKDTQAQQDTMAGQEFVQQNQQVQNDLKSVPRPVPPQLQQQQQAPVGAGPAATPTPTPEPQPTATPKPTVEETTIDGINYTIDRASRLAIPDGAVTESTLAQRVKEDIAARVGKVDQRDVNAELNRYNKRSTDLRKENKLANENIASRQEVLRAMERLATQLINTDSTWMMSKRGTIPEFMDKVQEISGVLGSEGSKLVMQNRAAIEQAKGAILTSFLGKEGRSTTVNSPTEQQTVIGTILSNNTDFRTFQNWIQQEKANLQREVDIADFREAAAMDPFYNPPEQIARFLKEYTQSQFSQPLTLNPEKYVETNGKLSLAPGAQDKDDFVANTDQNNPRGETYLTPLQYMKMRGMIKDYEKNPEGYKSKVTPTPTPQPSPTPAQPQQTSALGAIGGAIGDFFTPQSAMAEEVDVAPAGGGADFLGKQGETGSPQSQDGLSVKAEFVTPEVPPRPTAWDRMLEADNTPAPGSIADAMSLPADSGSEQDLINAKNPAKTLVQQRDYKFESPDAEARYNKVLAQVKTLRDMGALTALGSPSTGAGKINFFLKYYLPNAVLFKGQEEGRIALGKTMRRVGLLPADTTDARIREEAMAWEEAINTYGEDSIVESGFARAADLTGFLIQNIALTAALRGGAAATPGIRAAISAAPRTAAFGTNVVADVLQNAAIANDPSKSKTWEQLSSEALNTAAISGGSQFVLGALIRRLPAAYRAITGSADEGQLLAKLASGSFGITREEFENVLKEAARTGKDPRSLLPESAYPLLDELVSNPIARPYVERGRVVRAATMQKSIDDVTRNTGMDQIPGRDVLQLQFRNEMTNAVDDLTTTAKRVAESNRASAVAQATDELTTKSSQLVERLTTGGVDEGEQIIKQIDELFNTKNARLESPLGASGDLIDDIGTNARVLAAQSKYLNDTLNVAYGNLDDIPIPEDLFEQFVVKLQTDDAMPRGGAVIKDAAERFKKGGPLTEKGITELSNDAQSLIEMRGKLLNKMYQQELRMEMPQARLMVKEIDRTLKKAFKDTGFGDLPDDVFKKFMDVQSAGRSVRDKMLARKDILQQIEVNLQKNKGPSAVKDAIFNKGNLDNLNEVFGVDGAKQLKTQLKSVDDTINLLADFKKTGAFKPEALEAVAKKANSLGQADFFMNQLMSTNNLLPDELAALAGRSDRTAFGDAALRYFKDSVDKTATDTAGKMVDASSFEALSGLSPTKINNLKKFMDPNQQAAVDTFIDGYQAAQKAGRIADVPVSPTTPKTIFPATMSRRIVQTHLTALLDIVTSLYHGQITSKQVSKLAEAALDPDSGRFIKLLEDAAANMKPTPATGIVKNKAYSGLLEGQVANDAGKQIGQIINNLKTQQEVWDRRKSRLAQTFRNQDPSIETQMQELHKNTAENAFDKYIQQRSQRPEPPSMDMMFENYMRKRRVQ